MDSKKLIMDIVMWILVIAVAITVIWYAFGDSPSFEQSLILFLFGVSYNFGKSYFRFKENTVIAFSRVHNDVNHLRRDVDEIRYDIVHIRKGITDTKRDISEIKEILKKK